MERFRINRRYRIEDLVGQGRLAHVYRGYDEVLGRTIAIKVLRDDIVGIDSATNVLFTRAAQAAARLTHPHIVDIYDVGEHDGRPFVVMEYVPGQSLAQIIGEEAPFHPDEVAALAEQVATALDHAHRRGVLHGCLTPSNILVDQNGHAKIVDFGSRLAANKSPASGADAPKDAAYVAPEVLQEHAASSASDVYSLGVIAFEMLTGRRPLTWGASVTHTDSDQSTEPIQPFPPDAVLPPQLGHILSGAMSAPSHRRYKSAGHFAARLADWRSDADSEFLTPPRRPTISAPIAASQETQTIAPPDPVRDCSLEQPPRVDQQLRRPQRQRSVAPWLGSVALLAVLIMALAIAKPFEDMTPRFGREPLNQTEVRSSQSQTGENESVLTVPDVRGLSIEAARALLSDRGITLREDHPVFSTDVPNGAVGEQDPPPGTTLTPGQTVFVKPSRGAAETNVATLSLEGESAERARARLAELGLNVVIEHRGSPTVPEGSVVEVAAASSVAVGDTVTLIVSVGDKVQVPREAFGSGVEAASADLQASGLLVGQPIGVDRLTIERHIDLQALDIEPGEVVGVQNSAGDANFGAWVDRGTQVTLVYYDPSLD